MAGVSRLHEKSEDAHLALLSEVFQAPPTQVDAISSDRYLIFPAQEAVTTVAQGQSLTIDIPGASPGSIYDLSKSHILCRGRFVRGDGAATDADSNVAPVYLWTSRVFNRCSMSVGSVNAVEDFSNYGIAQFMDTHLRKTGTEMLADRYTSGSIPDDRNAGPYGAAVVVVVNGVTAVLNAGAAERRNWALQGTTVGGNNDRPNISWPMKPLGPWADGVKLPAGVGVRLRLTRGNDAELTYGEAGFSFQLETVSAYMYRMVLSPRADATLLKHFAKNDWLLSHRRVRQQTANFEAGTTLMEMRNALVGPRPSTVVVWTAFEPTLGGVYESATPFRFDANNPADVGGASQSCIEARLRVNDVDVPLRGMNKVVGNLAGARGAGTDWDSAGALDLAEMYEAYKQGCVDPTNPALSSSDFFNVKMFVFDCTICGVTDPMTESTQIQVSLRLDAPNRLRRTMGVISYTPSIISIDSSRQVLVD